MKLKRLEIFGFKSFAKKLDLRLEGGITSVVGPNGCGKTNVVDAIRWVLGEQRPSQIRLERMEDVIFKGSDSRRKLGMAEVSLTIDNESGILPLDMPEVTVTRRLFRTGESEYLINRKAARLADINELLMDTGMGTDSYSLFEQGMINSILSDKTEDRRHIFEEAAGITKYKARRRAALNKLAGIEEDLDRVGDIVAELERRVESLRRQASRARRYRELKTEMRERSVAMAAREVSAQRRKAADAADGLDAVSMETESLKVAVARLTGDQEALAVELVDVEKELETVAGAYNDDLVAVNEREKEITRLTSRMEYLGEKTARAREDARRSAATLDELAERHGTVAEDLRAVTERLSGMESETAGLVDAYRAFEAGVNERTAGRDGLRSENAAVERRMAELRASLDTITARRETGQARLDEISERLGQLDTSISSARTDLGRIAEEKRVHENRGRDITTRLDGLRATRTDITGRLGRLDLCIRDLREKEAAVRAERDFLAGLVRSLDGYAEGVRNAVAADVLDGRVLGVLGDMVSTDDVYVKAVEAAFAERLQYVLVDDADAARDGVLHLADGARGRASFMPAGATAGTPDGSGTVSGPGVIGPARTLVRASGGAGTVVDRLLGGVVVVDTLDTALGLRSTHPGLTFVTLAGEKCGPLGDMHGGRTAGDETASIGRMERIAALDDTLAHMERERSELTSKRDSLSDEAGATGKAMTSLEADLEEVREILRDRASDEARASATISAATDMAANLRAERDRIGESFSRYSEQTAAIESDIEAAATELSSLGERLASAEADLAERRAELEKRRSAVNGNTVEQAALTEKKASLSRELDMLRERREALAQSIGRARAEVEDAEREVLDIGGERARLNSEIEDLSRGLEAIRSRKDATERRHADLASRRSEIDSELGGLRHRLMEQSRRESALTLERDQAAMRIRAVVDRLRDDYLIDEDDIRDVPADPGDGYDSERERAELDELRRKLHGLGDVNMAAEKDYEEEKKRLDFITSERDDLVAARRTLEETITKINRIARDRFSETFDRIRENYRRTFTDFFDGGFCDLELEENDDPLEATIRITARPPGKNVRSIGLLSSGERALTAISLLFAIYLVKPSPFCILDEVDAPLDDANIDRYLHVIREFSRRTQFIMVTHNKKTMSAADNLYGITMEEPGLSTLVSVRLSQVDTIGATGGTAASRRSMTAP